MARILNCLVLILLEVATMFDVSAAQTRHVVGDDMGWTIPSDEASSYIKWAANKTFTLSNTLVFNYASGHHDVAKVTKEDFDACNGDNPIVSITNSPASFMLNETGEQYYICTFGSHCSLGQKLSINVTQPSSSAPAPAPKTSTSPPHQTPSNAIPPQISVAACVGLSATLLLSIAEAFLY